MTYRVADPALAVEPAGLLHRPVPGRGAGPAAGPDRHAARRAGPAARARPARPDAADRGADRRHRPGPRGGRPPRWPTSPRLRRDRRRRWSAPAWSPSGPSRSWSGRCRRRPARRCRRGATGPPTSAGRRPSSRSAAIAENELQNKIELARREQQLVEQHGANARRTAELDAAAQLVARRRAERRAAADGWLAAAEAEKDAAAGRGQGPAGRTGDRRSPRPRPRRPSSRRTGTCRRVLQRPGAARSSPASCRRSASSPSPRTCVTGLLAPARRPDVAMSVTHARPAGRRGVAAAASSTSCSPGTAPAPPPAYFLRQRGRDLDEVRGPARGAAGGADRRSAPRSRPTGGAATWTATTCPGSSSRPRTSSSPSGRTGWSPTWPSTSTGSRSSASTRSPAATPGCWCRFAAAAVAAAAAGGRRRQRAPTAAAPWSVAVLDDGQELVGLNEVYVGHQTHQSSRYVLATPDGRAGAALVVGRGGRHRHRRHRLVRLDRAERGRRAAAAARRRSRRCAGSSGRPGPRRRPAWS